MRDNRKLIKVLFREKLIKEVLFREEMMKNVSLDYLVIYIIKSDKNLNLQIFAKSLKVNQCRFENLSICSICSCSHENNTLNISSSYSQEFSSYLPVNFVFFLKSKLLFNVFHCFCMFVNKLFQSLRVTNSRILRIKNAKLSRYYFDIN